MNENNKNCTKDDIIHCDRCGNSIEDIELNLYHTTALIRNKLNKHTHLCAHCFSACRINIPYIYCD